jgi:hypothetical protein
MLKSIIREMTLAVQTRTGLTPVAVVWMMVIALAVITAFAFLCVAAYDWLSSQFGSVYAALILAGVFVLIAIFGAVVCALVRRRARERAILERAARAHAPSWLLDPKLLATAVQIGRSMGWERIIPVVLLGFLAAQWARERRDQGRESGD